MVSTCRSARNRSLSRPEMFFPAGSLGRTMSDRAAFLAGDRPDDVLLFVAESAVSGFAALAELGERVADGVVLVVEGERGREAFERATGLDPMAFAGDAMGTDGTVDPECSGGTCPAADAANAGGGDEEDSDGHRTEPHAARFLFAFAEERNEAAGGIYAEGDVIHAYVACTCGETYADKWVAGQR
jgi:hypothetical protein